MAGVHILKKLRMQPGQRVLILNPPPGYLEGLGDLPEGVRVADQPEGTFEFVQGFARDLAQLEKLAPVAAQAVKHDGLLWVAYPKKSAEVESDLSREVVWETVAKTGLRPVAQVSVNDVWSALQFRPLEKVGKQSVAGVRSGAGAEAGKATYPPASLDDLAAVKRSASASLAEQEGAAVVA